MIDLQLGTFESIAQYPNHSAAILVTMKMKFAKNEISTTLYKLFCYKLKIGFFNSDKNF